MAVPDYYKYAQLATAAYVRMATEPLTGKKFAEVAREQLRFPTSIATELFNPADPTASRWTIAHYYGSDNTADPNASQTKSGFAATLFRKSGENVLAVRGMEPIVNFTGITRDLITLTVL